MNTISKPKTFLIIIALILIIITGYVAASRFITSKGNNTLEQISLEEFSELLTTNNTEDLYIYIGRESCPSCSTLYPAINDISKKVDILYYSTEVDRISRPDKMNAFLKTLNIKSVPTIIKIESGTVKEVYDGDEFINLFT